MARSFVIVSSTVDYVWITLSLMCGIPGLVLGTYIHHDLECSFSVFLDFNINWIVVDIVTLSVCKSLSHG